MEESVETELHYLREGVRQWKGMYEAVMPIASALQERLGAQIRIGTALIAERDALREALLDAIELVPESEDTETWHVAARAALAKASLIKVTRSGTAPRENVKTQDQPRPDNSFHCVACDDGLHACSCPWGHHNKPIRTVQS